MNQEFNVEEIFNIAIATEQHGLYFYTEASRIIHTPSEKELLLKLAQMEKEHESTFLSLKEAHTEKDEAPFPDLENLNFAYLQLLSKDKIFKKNHELDQWLKNNPSYKEILKMALRFEKDTVVFFTMMKANLEREEDQEKVDCLIQEELHHINILSKELNKVDC